MVHHYKKFRIGDTITKEQKEFFNEFGFIHFENFIPAHAVETIIQASLEVQQKWVSQGITKINGVPIKYGVDLDGSPIVQRFAFINQHHPTLSEFLLDPRFSTLLELAGPGARLGTEEKDGMVFNHYVNSEGSQFTQMGWHVDGLRDIFYGLKLSPMLNVGIHLSSLKPENGGLRLIPGTHKQGLKSMLFRKAHFINNDVDPEEVAVIAKAGDLTIHDGRLWHRVAKSSVIGEESRRRVIYIPVVTGKYEPKNENSPTQLYQRFAGLVK
jgi:ectoine hydroxylase-related dioxygenase (phytanoyl-CoA dioxygenase family)